MTTTAEKPRRRRSNGEASRQKILEAATEIATERGYEGTSIGLVSKRSGLPASSIYWHFKDKDALIAAVIENSFGAWLAAAGEWVPRTPDAPVEQRAAATIRRAAEGLLESSDFLRLGLMLALERRAEEPSARRMFLSVRQEALRRTTASYCALFPELRDEEARKLAILTISMFDGLFIAWEIDGAGADLLADSDLLTAAALGAVDRLLARRRPTP
jgi:AcrR family transcriptional regulator